jgi:hypothetical protein
LSPRTESTVRHPTGYRHVPWDTKPILIFPDLTHVPPSAANISRTLFFELLSLLTLSCHQESLQKVVVVAADVAAVVVVVTATGSEVARAADTVAPGAVVTVAGHAVAGVAGTVVPDAVPTEVVSAEVAVDAATEEPVTVAVGLAVAPVPVPVPVEAVHPLSQPIMFRP